MSTPTAWTRETLLEVIRTALDSFPRVAPESVIPEADFFEDIGLDYFDHIEFIMALEDALGIDIPDPIAETCQTVNQALDALLPLLPASENAETVPTSPGLGSQPNQSPPTGRGRHQ